ncbi:MAG: hypothetical protein K5920_08530 [Bacteroidales bacterium]|nr:hypothetical protein [Bacteroidales bacterium]
MKKLILTLSIVLGLSAASFAQGGLFKRGDVNEKQNSESSGLVTPGLPNHDMDGNQPAPLGGGAAVLITLGAAYALTKKRKD